MFDARKTLFNTIEMASLLTLKGHCSGGSRKKERGFQIFWDYATSISGLRRASYSLGEPLTLNTLLAVDTSKQQVQIIELATKS